MVFLTNIISHAVLLKDAAMLPDASLQHYGLRGRLKKKNIYMYIIYDAFINIEGSNLYQYIYILVNIHNINVLIILHLLLFVCYVADGELFRG